MRIRPVQKEDAADILAIYGPYIRDTAFTFETELPSLASFEARITAYTATHPWLVAEDQGRVVGYAYASKYRERAAYQWTVESSVYVLEAYHHTGIAAQLYTRLFEALKEAGFVNVFAVITLPNPKSYSFHQRLGFEPFCVYRNIGYKLGRWHDVAWMLKIINPYSEAPQPPRLPGQ